jgi:hypothetical protein
MRCYTAMRGNAHGSRPSGKYTDGHFRRSRSVWWAWLDLNQRPHPETKIARVATGSAAPRAELGRARPILIPRGGPRPWGSYQQSRAHRYATQRFRRSGSTVEGEVMRCSRLVFSPPVSLSVSGGGSGASQLKDSAHLHRRDPAAPASGPVLRPQTNVRALRSAKPDAGVVLTSSAADMWR